MASLAIATHVETCNGTCKLVPSIIILHIHTQHNLKLIYLTFNLVSRFRLALFTWGISTFIFDLKQRSNTRPEKCYSLCLQS